MQTSFDGSTVHFSFGIPRGNDGSQGPQGGPFTNFVMDQVNTLPQWEYAAVQATFDGTAIHLAVGIPGGADGQPGQVTNSDLATAVAGSSTNTNAVATLDALFLISPLPPDRDELG